MTFVVGFFARASECASVMAHRIGVIAGLTRNPGYKCSAGLRLGGRNDTGSGGLWRSVRYDGSRSRDWILGLRPE
jgi:hypothetical protein